MNKTDAVIFYLQSICLLLEESIFLWLQKEYKFIVAQNSEKAKILKK